MISSEHFNSIAALDLEPIKVKLMHEESGEGWSLEKVNAVEFEYRRFLYLMKMFPNEQTAPLMDVDIFWHYHILDTMKYAADCDNVFGYFLHHFPYIGLRGEDDEEAHKRVGDRMKELYEETFGEAYLRAEPAYSGRISAAAAGTAYSGRISGDVAYSGRISGQTAYSGRISADTAYSGRIAYSGRVSAPTIAAQTAYSGRISEPNITAKTAYSGRVSNDTAYSGRVAYSGRISAGASAQTAYSGRISADAPAQTAYSGRISADAPVQTAYSGRISADAPARTAYSGRVGTDTAYSGRISAETAYSGRIEAAPQDAFYSARPRLAAA